MSRRGAIAGGAAVAAATAALYFVSRGKWSDVVIDSGREWIVPDAISRGALLYRDVVYWFGPFTPYFQAAFLKFFGSGFPALVIAGAVASLALLGVLRWALGRVTGSAEAWLWTALAIPVLVFMPEGGGSLLGMGYRIWHAAAFSLAAVALAGGGRPSSGRAAAVGLLAAGAGLCRSEWGLVGLAAALTVTVLEGPDGRVAVRRAAVSALAFFVAFGGALAAFVKAAGWKSVIEDGHVLLTGLSPETRTFLVRFSGIADWRRGAPEGLYVAASWVGAFLVVAMTAAWRRQPAAIRRLAPALAASFVVMIVGGVAGGWGAKPYSGAPWICLGAAIVALLRRRGSSSPMLAGCGLAGVLLSYRRPFHIGDSGYVGPPLLFALVCAAGLAELALREGAQGSEVRGRRLFRLALGSLVAFAFALRIHGYAEDERVPVAGTGGMLAARAELARRVERLSRHLAKTIGPDGGLVVLPEGEILNALSGRRNPMRYMLFLPGYLSDSNEEDVIREFERARPSAVVVLYRPTSEYGPSIFGEDYGLRLAAYLGEHYDFRDFSDEDRVRSRVGGSARIGTRRARDAADAGAAR